MNHIEKIKNRIDAAMGRVQCDLILKNVSYLDVFNCEWRRGDVSVKDGVIVGLESGLKGKKEILASGLSLVPGFIDAHVHIESSCMNPSNFERSVLAKGTTSVVADPHELANVLGLKGIEYFLRAAEKTNLDLRVMLSSCVPATHMETNGGGTLSDENLKSLANHPKVLGLAEMMNVPGVLFKDEEVLKKLVSFSGTNIDGHCPLLRGQELSAYISTGVSTCHESSEIDEAREKLYKGMKVWIREGSVAKDLNTLLPLLNLASSTSLGFCTDDRNPLDIISDGHLDYMIRTAITSGVSPAIAYRTASWSVARHYGLDRGFEKIGAIAPGYKANFVLLEDSKAVGIRQVFMGGVPTNELSYLPVEQSDMRKTVKAAVPELVDLKAPTGNVHVIVVHPGKIITGREVNHHDAEGIASLSVLERYGRGAKPANAYVKGFGPNFKGAIASSVGHDSHNLIVVGTSSKEMQLAFKAVIEMQGGFAVVKGDKVLASLALPIGGLMSDEAPSYIENKLRELRKASHSIGCALTEPFLQLAFLSLPVIPSLKLTDKGLVDVEKFQIINVRVA